MKNKRKQQSNDKAVNPYAKLNTAEENVKTSIEVGTDGWNCDGYELTPAMRREILMVLVEIYQEWTEEGYSYEWDLADDGWPAKLDPVEQKAPRKVGDFLQELTGYTDEDEPSLPLSYADDFEAWLEEFLRETWDEGVDDDLDRDPIGAALDRVREWVTPLNIADLIAWRQAAARVA